MTQRAHIFVFLLYALGAVFVAFWLPEFMPGVSRILSYIAGGFIVMAGGLLHQAMLGKTRARAQAHSLGELNRLLNDVLKDQRKLEDDMLQLRATLAHLASAPNQDVGDVVNEVKVLQKLIEQLYGARTAGSKGAPKPVTHAKSAAAPIVNVEKPAAPKPPAPKPVRPASPSSGGGLRGLFSTHPATEERVARLRALAAGR